jgi:trehalose 6-phosphate phosphatase
LRSLAQPPLLGHQTVNPRGRWGRDLSLLDVTPVDQVVERLAHLLGRARAGLFTDFDGTLSPLASTPAGATIDPSASLALRELVTRIEVVGIVTGRAADDARERVGIPDLLYVGNHGLEWTYHGEHAVHPAGLATEKVLTSALLAIQKRLRAVASLDGVIFENKRLSGSVHYRLSEDPLTVGNALASIAAEVADEYGLRLSGGKMVFELRPQAPVNKGTAIEELISRYILDSAVFFGDDITDVDGFLALHRVAQHSETAVCSIGVLTADTARSVIESSDILLDGVQGVAETLHGLNQRLRAAGRQPQSQSPRGGS